MSSKPKFVLKGTASAANLKQGSLGVDDGPPAQSMNNMLESPDHQTAAQNAY